MHDALPKSTLATPLLSRTCPLLRGLALLVAVACVAPAFAQIPEQYPKPLVHTPADHPAARVMLISVDGLHGFDLANYVAAHPRSTLAALSMRGVTFTNAHVPWADPLSGLASLVTGGGPISTGLYAEEASPPLPADRHAPVNTLFEIVHEKIGSTAWAGESEAANELLRGASGKGLDRVAMVPRTAASTGDLARVAAVEAWIADTQQPVPALFGLSLAGIAAAQSSRVPAYLDVAGTPSIALTAALDVLDRQLASLVRALALRQLYDSTWIVVVGPYGESRMDPRHARVIALTTLARSVSPASVAHVSGGDIALIWLTDRSNTGTAVASLARHTRELGIADIFAGPRLELLFMQPGGPDPRAPDLIVAPAPDVLYGDPATARTAAHGGLTDWNTHVALLVSGAQLTGRRDPTWVPTTQLAPLLLRSLGLEKFDLQALHQEHTPALPGIF